MKKLTPLLFLFLCSAFCFAQDAQTEREVTNSSIATIQTENPKTIHATSDASTAQVEASATSAQKRVPGTFLRPGTKMVAVKQRDSLYRKVDHVRTPRAF